MQRGKRSLRHLIQWAILCAIPVVVIMAVVLVERAVDPPRRLPSNDPLLVCLRHQARISPTNPNTQACAGLR